MSDQEMTADPLFRILNIVGVMLAASCVIVYESVFSELFFMAFLVLQLPAFFSMNGVRHGE